MTSESSQQQHPEYVAPADPGMRRTPCLERIHRYRHQKALHAEYSALTGVHISRPLCEQEYGMIEFDVIDLNGQRLVFAQPVE